MNLVIDSQSFFNYLQLKAKRDNQRAFIIFIGDVSWLQKQNYLANRQLSFAGGCNYFDLDVENSSEYFTAINRLNFRNLLGTEQNKIVFNAHAEFNVDAFTALSGVVPAGGVLILSLAETLLTKSLFCQRFLQYCLAHDNIKIIRQHQELAYTGDFSVDTSLINQVDTKSALNSLQQTVQNFLFGAKTQDQELAIQAVLKVAVGRSNRPLVITADRGRGKSTALALAVVELMKTSSINIIITAPHPDAVNVFFEQIINHLPEAKRSKQQITIDNSQARFIPVDALVAQKLDCQLLLIDEAAGIPLPLLRHLLDEYHRLVFVSTIHGYEGAGRGFSQKFLSELKQRKSQSKHLHLKQPIRWAEGDQLEKVLFEALLLNADLAKFPAKDDSVVCFRVYTGAQLAANDPLLNEVFALLVGAHYQTKPSDLQMLLDDPKVLIVVTSKQQHVVGVALLLKEGGIDEQLSSQVQQSLRRLKGHFLPQSLLVHCGVSDAFEYQYLRIIRIAIHPELQGCGYGKRLLDFCRQVAVKHKIDFIGSSFGANNQLLKFWLSNGYSCARMGFTKDAASGEHSALVFSSLTVQAKQRLTTITDQFYLDLPIYLCDEYKYLAPGVVSELLRYNPAKAKPTQWDVDAVKNFIRGYRILSATVPSISRWLIAVYPQAQYSLGDVDRHLLIAKFLQKHKDTQLIKDFNVTGKKALLQKLKKALAVMLDDST